MWSMTVWKVVTVLACLVLIGDILQVSALTRQRRSPFKKHKIVVIDEAQIDGGGWGAPPPPPPPPVQETVVEHHHHHWVERPAAPPPSHSHSVVIEVNKGDHGGKFKEEGEKIKEFKAAVDASFGEIEKDKKATLDILKQDAEDKLDALSKIPHLIASDIDFLGQKIAEDLDRKKDKEGGISIHVWKGKGDVGGHHGGHYHTGSTYNPPPPPPAGGETVHHHHYYHESVQQAPPPPPPQKEYPPPPPPQYEGGSYGSGGGWHQGGGGGGLEKGFSINLWKSKGFGRRR